jgi:two-component system chemotaxis response regulator CheY
MSTVLVVDDSHLVRALVGRALGHAGFSIVEAADGEEALRRLRETPETQLVICDVNMPNMNGLEFLQAIRAEPLESKVPVIILTTRGQLDLLGQARSLGARCWILKPFDAEQLVELAKRLTLQSS